MGPNQLWLMTFIAGAFAGAFTLSLGLKETNHQEEHNRPVSLSSNFSCFRREDDPYDSQRTSLQGAANFAGCRGNCSDPASLPNQQGK